MTGTSRIPIRPKNHFRNSIIFAIFIVLSPFLAVPILIPIIIWIANNSIPDWLVFSCVVLFALFCVGLHRLFFKHHTKQIIKIGHFKNYKTNDPKGLDQYVIDDFRQHTAYKYHLRFVLSYESAASRVFIAHSHYRGLYRSSGPPPALVQCLVDSKYSWPKTKIMRTTFVDRYSIRKPLLDHELFDKHWTIQSDDFDLIKEPLFQTQDWFTGSFQEGSNDPKPSNIEQWQFNENRISFSTTTTLKPEGYFELAEFVESFVQRLDLARSTADKMP